MPKFDIKLTLLVETGPFYNKLGHMVSVSIQTIMVRNFETFCF